MSKRQGIQKLSQLAQQLPTAPRTIRPPAAVTEWKHKVDKSSSGFVKPDPCDLIRSIVEQAFPHAVTVFRTSDLSSLATSVPAYATPKVTPFLARQCSVVSSVRPPVANSQSEWLFGEFVTAVTTFTSKGATAPNLGTARLGADAVVQIGGYSGRDLARVVMPELLKVIPMLEGATVTFDVAKQRQRRMLNDDRLPVYQRTIAMQEDMTDKQCFLRSDVLDLRVPTFMDRPEGVGDPSRRHRVVIGFGDPEWFPSMLNMCERDDLRLLLRPGFGYSEWVLEQRLPPVMVKAAKNLKQMSRNTRILRHRTHKVTGAVPSHSLAFWLSCVAHVMEAVNNDGGAWQGVPEVEAVRRSVVPSVRSSSTPLLESGPAPTPLNIAVVDDDVITAETEANAVQALMQLVVRCLEGEADAVIPAAVRWDVFATNYYLPVETFHRLPWWRTLQLLFASRTNV